MRHSFKMQDSLKNLKWARSQYTVLPVFVALMLAAIPVSLLAVPTRKIELSSAETAITVEAGQKAPRLLEVRLLQVRLSEVRLPSQNTDRWINQTPEPLIDHVTVDGVPHPLHWRLQASAGTQSADMVRLVYETDEPHLRLTWQWSKRAAQGPMEHTINIQNLSPHEIWLPLQPSFHFDWSIDAKEPLQRLWLEKGSGKPSSVGTHLDDLHAGDAWTGISSSYANARENDFREMIPYVLVSRADGNRAGWYMGLEFSGRSRITLERGPHSLQGEAGINPDPGPFKTRLLPGESFEAPPIFLGAFSGGPDGAGNILRRWVREVLNNPVTVQNPSYPFMTSNTWGEGMQINETQAYRMIDTASQLGLEMLHIDAGWFRGVGDWAPSPTNFPHGLAPVADEAHRRGLKFGIWVNWAQAGVGTGPGSINVNDPKVKDWLIADAPPNWQPDSFVGRTMDIAVPAVTEYTKQEIERLVQEYHLDMLEHDGYLVAQNCSRTDHPHAVASHASPTSVIDGNGLALPDDINSSDVSYHAVRAYYDIYAHTRQQHPSLLFEICDDGGRMVDFGSAAHGDYFSITDTYDPLANRRAFYDASYVFPSAMLETYADRWPTPRIENLRYMLRSGMMGWFSLMFDTTQPGNTNSQYADGPVPLPRWTPEDFAAAREEFALYKDKLRPLIRTADLYHVSPRPDGIHWDGMEYFDPRSHRGVLFAFHGTAAEENTHRFLLQGLNPKRSYRLVFQDRQPASQIVLSGQALMEKGIELSLPVPLSSDLVFFQEE